ncbi:MAG TPA: ATPase [Treponema sp.]|nr:ATPase [Treponema sp.]
MYIKRSVKKHLDYLSRHFPAVVITGARQTGKSTLVKEFAAEKGRLSYVTLDYPFLRNLARTDPEIFLQQYKPPVIIDEIQYAPELLPYIKIAIDENRSNGMYYLTGSQMFRLMKDVSESLAGRVGIIQLYGLSRAEILPGEEEPFLPSSTLLSKSEETITSVFDKIYRGSMPLMVVDKSLTPDAFFAEYVQTYIERDIRELMEIKNERKFLQFLSCVAVRTGQELNLSDIAKDVGIDSKTADSWISLLVTSGLVFLLQPYSGNTIKRIVKRPKLYLMDTGLACYLGLWNNPRALEVSAVAGNFFETYVVSEIIKTYTNSGIDVRSRFSYYRDNNGKEIDLIIEENGVLYPIEIKKSANPGKDALKNFSVLSSLNKTIGNGAVMCLSSFPIPLDSGNMQLPLSVL